MNHPKETPTLSAPALEQPETQPEGSLAQAERAVRLLAALTPPSTPEEQARLRRGMQALLRAERHGRLTFRWRDLA